MEQTIEMINVIKELNESISLAFGFYLITDRHEYIIELVGDFDYKFKTEIFCSEDPNFNKEIEGKYEEDKITYEEAVKQQCICNTLDFQKQINSIEMV